VKHFIATFDIETAPGEPHERYPQIFAHVGNGDNAQEVPQVSYRSASIGF
jgi:hypothetical protein